MVSLVTNEEHERIHQQKRAERAGVHKIDFLGQVVIVGDCIFYSTTGRYAESRLGKVTRMTEKSMWIKILRKNRPGTVDGKEVIVQNDFVKVY